MIVNILEFSFCYKIPDFYPIQIKLQHGEVLVLDSLALRVKMAAFKRLLGGGIQTHLSSNPLLQDVFGIEGPNSSGGGSRWESSDRQEARKGREAGRRSERALKSSSRGGGYSHDGY